MKTIRIKLIFLLVLFLAYSYSVFANDVIRLTWQTSENISGRYRALSITVTEGREFIVDWGDDSAIETLTGEGVEQVIAHNYIHANNYSVIISGITSDCLFTSFRCIGQNLTVLDVSANKALQNLDCSHNSLTILDVSSLSKLNVLQCADNQLKNLNVNGCISLEDLQCMNNQLTDLNVNMCVHLKHLHCMNNQLTDLDISANTTLQLLLCSYNQLTDLNLRNKEALVVLLCDNNQLTNLDINGCTRLETLWTDNNHLSFLDVSTNTNLKVFRCQYNKLKMININGTMLAGFNCAHNYFQLSELYYISEMLNGLKFLTLGTQILETETCIVGSSFDYSAQKEFNGITTDFYVEKDGLPASQNDYSIIKGVITFNNAGNYRVIMTNDAIISNTDYLDTIQVITHFYVSSSISTPTFLVNLAVSDGTLTPAFSSTHFNYIVNVESTVTSMTLVATPSEFATVIGDGLKELSVGENIFTIIVITKDGETTLDYVVTVTVIPVAVAGVNLNKETTTLYVGDTEQLIATILPVNAINKNVTWVSNNTEIVTVSNTGFVTAINTGTAVITVTTEDGEFTAQCSVTVNLANVPVTDVTLNITNTTLEIGNIEQLTATVLSDNANNKNVTWSSNNTGIATVNSAGLVTAINVGTAIITVTTEEGNFMAHCSVNVPVNTDDIELLDGLEILLNPTTGQFSVVSKHLSIKRIEVFDIYGRIQSHIPCLTCSEKTIDISHLPVGIYFVRILTEKGTVTRKLVKR